MNHGKRSIMMVLAIFPAKCKYDKSKPKSGHNITVITSLQSIKQIKHKEYNKTIRNRRSKNYNKESKN